MSAEERREQVIGAAIEAFARGGYEGTSTGVIADRVGVSQPYLFRLFPSKRALFIAAVHRCFDVLEERLREAGGGLHGHEAYRALGDRYERLLVEEPTLLQFQLQVYATALDHEDVRAVGRERWAGLWRTVDGYLAFEPAEMARFMAVGMLMNVLRALDVPYVNGPTLSKSVTEWAAREAAGAAGATGDADGAQGAGRDAT